MVLTTDGFLELAIESWSEWNLNPRALNSIQTLKPADLSGHEFHMHSQPILYSHSNFIVFGVSHFYWLFPFISHHVNLIEVFFR